MQNEGIPGIKALARLGSRHFRKKNGLCLVEGLRCCEEALRKCQLLALYCTRAFRESPQWQRMEVLSVPLQPTILDDGQFAALSETETPQGIAAVIRTQQLQPASGAELPFTLILDKVADPGNLGTILRTAWAVGLTGCWLVKGCADPFSPKSIRSGMGAQFSMALHQFDSLEEAVKTVRGFGAKEVWCTMPASGISIFDQAFSLPESALIIGNEANGISNPRLGKAVTIPMPGGAESLNAAQAATVFLVESLR